MTFVKNLIPWNKGKTYHNIGLGRKLSEAHKKALCVPRKGAGVYLRTQYHKDITSQGMKNLYAKGFILGFKKSKYKNTGEKNNNWKGGITPINSKIRKSLKYKSWRMAVFKRDNYVCQICFKRGGIINADHIKQFAFFPELRFELSNGRTLCQACHRKTDTYSRKYIVST